MGERDWERAFFGAKEGLLFADSVTKGFQELDTGLAFGGPLLVLDIH